MSMITDWIVFAAKVAIAASLGTVVVLLVLRACGAVGGVLTAAGKLTS